MTNEPAIRAKLTTNNTALFDTVDDFLLWIAQTTSFSQFANYHRKAKAPGVAMTLYKRFRSEDEKRRLEEICKRTLCTDGSTLFDAMVKRGKQKPR